MTPELMLQKMRDGDYDTKLPWSKDPAARQAYRSDEGVLLMRFREDIAKAFGVEDNPKFGRCYELAWDYGHSCGIFDIFSYFSDLVELIKD